MPSFSGTVESDFLKLVQVEDVKKDQLINFSNTDFLTLRNSLIEYVKSVYPLDYNNFTESDLGMMLIELMAYMGHVNSFKADFLANENFLTTARQKNSVKKLLELIGVRMKGPISAAANAQLTLNSDPGWGPTTDYIRITPDQRVITINSPEDGAPLTFTLYKVAADGDVALANDSGDLELYQAEGDTDTLFTNLVFLEGALVKENGTFNATESVKSVALTQYPIVEGSVQVFVSGDLATSGAYERVDNIYFASGATDKVFQLVSDDDFRGTVVFGDDVLGASPRPGDQYIVTYRVGGGTRGNIKNNLINTTLTTNFVAGVPSNINGQVINTSKGTGGADSETIEHAKRYAPLTFRRQDRVVTVQDFKTFGNSFISSYGSVGKVTAVVRRAYSSANIIDLFVLERANDTQLRKATPEFKRDLLNALDPKKMLTDEIVIVDGLIRTLDLIITARVDRELKPRGEEIKLKVRDKVLDFFHVDNMDFGKTLNTQELNRAVFELDDVRFSTIDNIPAQINVNFNEIIQLNNLTVNLTFV